MKTIKHAIISTVYVLAHGAETASHVLCADTLIGCLTLQIALRHCRDIPLAQFHGFEAGTLHNLEQAATWKAVRQHGTAVHAWRLAAYKRGAATMHNNVKAGQPIFAGVVDTLLAEDQYV